MVPSINYVLVPFGNFKDHIPPMQTDFEHFERWMQVLEELFSFIYNYHPMLIKKQEKTTINKHTAPETRVSRNIHDDARKLRWELLHT